MRRISLSYAEIREMPIMYRNWFIKRYIREVEELNSQRRKADSATGRAESAMNTFESRIGRMGRSS